MYEVSYSQIVKDCVKESYPSYVILSDLERALAFASLLQKISTSEVKFEDILIKPFKFNEDEKIKENSSAVSEN